MYSVIKQFCPDCCLTICLSKVVTPTPVVPLGLFTVQFFYHSLGLHTAPVARSLFRPHYVFIANLQWTFQALQHFFFFSKSFFSHRFHFETCNKKAKSCWTRTWSGQQSIFVRFFPVHICSCCWILTVVSTFLVSSWNSSAVAWAAPSFVLLQSMCHSDNFQTAVAAATSQAKLCTYNEEETGTVRRGGQQIAKAQICQGSGQPAQASPPRHFRHSQCLQWVRSTFPSFERRFAWAVRKEQMAAIFWTALTPHGDAGPQA